MSSKRHVAWRNAGGAVPRPKQKTFHAWKPLQRCECRPGEVQQSMYEDWMLSSQASVQRHVLVCSFPQPPPPQQQVMINSPCNGCQRRRCLPAAERGSAFRLGCAPRKLSCQWHPDSY